MYDPDLGREQFAAAMSGSGNPDEFVRHLDWHGFLWLIHERLDTIYPEDIYGANTAYVSWSGEHGGEDIDPGVRWVVLLREALKQLEEK